MQVRECGLKQSEAASTTLWQSTIAGGKYAVVAGGTSQTFFEGCRLQDCGQEAVLGLQRARVNLADTHISGCHGPAIDMSDDSSVVLKQVDVVNCEGGIFLWHRTSCEVSLCTWGRRRNGEQSTSEAGLLVELLVKSDFCLQLHFTHFALFCSE